jgi:DNA processing protein
MNLARSNWTNSCYWIAWGYDPTPVDVIVERSGLTADTVSSMLLIVELKGLIAAAGGLYVRLTPGTM